MGKIATSGRSRKALDEAPLIMSNKKRPTDDVLDTAAKKVKKSSTVSSVNPPDFVYGITLPGEEDVNSALYHP